MQAIDDAKPDAIFNVLFGPDLAKFVREGNTRGVFKDRFVASLLSGEPEYIDPLKDEAPVGWLVTGYPWYAINTARSPDVPRRLPEEVQRLSAARLGGRLCHGEVAGRRHRQGRLDRHRQRSSRPSTASRWTARSARSSIAAATTRRPWAPIVGKLALKDGKPVMVDFKYVDGAAVLPPDAEVKKLRPAE